MLFKDQLYFQISIGLLHCSSNMNGDTSALQQILALPQRAEERSASCALGFRNPTEITNGVPGNHRPKPSGMVITTGPSGLTIRGRDKERGAAAENNQENVGGVKRGRRS